MELAVQEAMSVLPWQGANALGVGSWGDPLPMEGPAFSRNLGLLDTFNITGIPKVSPGFQSSHFIYVEVCSSGFLAA